LKHASKRQRHRITFVGRQAEKLAGRVSSQRTVTVSFLNDDDERTVTTAGLKFGSGP
jgi:hypothetical protein